VASPNYYLLAGGIILIALVLMAVRFEGRKPRAREIVVLAVMTALAVAGRAAFFMLPQFKPVAAIVIIAGVALGAESGFLVGVLAAFVSNFIFGQGPWTPFQMIAFGLIGLIAGLIFYRKDRGALPGVVGMTSMDDAVSTSTVASTLTALTRSKRVDFAHILALCVYGGLSVTVMYGLVVDILYMLMFSESVSLQALVAVLISGVPFNVIHGISTVFFLAVLAHPMIEKLERIKLKFGLAARSSHEAERKATAPKNPGSQGRKQHSEGHGQRIVSLVLSLVLAGTVGLSTSSVAVAETGSTSGGAPQSFSDPGAVAREQLIEAVSRAESVTFWIGSDPEKPDYTWTFDGALLEPYQAERLPPLALDVYATEQAFAGRSIDTLALEFAWQGDLPVPVDMAVRLPSALVDATPLALYRLNRSTGTYELGQAAVAVDAGYASFILISADPVALSTADLSGSPPQEGGTAQGGGSNAGVDDGTATTEGQQGAAQGRTSDDSSPSKSLLAVLPWAIAGVLAVILGVVAASAIIRQRRARMAAEMEGGWFKDFPSIDELARDPEGTIEEHDPAEAVEVHDIEGAVEDIEEPNA
jgi:energy-coupling factor transport system substrate-specific component